MTGPTTTAPDRPTLAIVLTGGRGSRLGGVEKALVQHAGTTLLESTLRALARGGALRVVLVGPHEPPEAPADEHAIAWRAVVEEPRFGGPALALAAGVTALAEWQRADGGASPDDRDTWVTVLACDLSAPERALDVLDARGAGIDDDGVVLEDADGRAQWLTARYRLPALREALEEVEPDTSVRRALGGLDLALVPAGDAVADIDTPEDLSRVGASVPVTVVSGRMAATNDDVVKEATVSVPPNLERWVAELAPRLGLEPDDVPVPLLLDLARDVAHGAVRPGAPVSAFMLGLAIGTGRVTDLEAAAESITELADGWAEADRRTHEVRSADPEDATGE
ncbi:NTP transferase domain-containing protein [Pseudoclavibacter chungangensis]|uniref:NTP transferase domain-containing protein n=1 Tax=Pseudoclavibacter chungangensis TaxID=587635 RepID=A0A7J5BQ20_9MICO|nr:DUF6457 domain-containing protein [Pseudoclavibacter chungangensis]KAB1655650.1 NTP transferase domain-containing protein [Pseudoclavibacter chungangensis]NYJ67948.1 molybdopterin-guanine dinucleotide biosynthesis protein A [Pseudoclavibacter chungangensis]